LELKEGGTMANLNFNYRDLFRSARLAFSLQRIWINFVGLAVGYAVYLIFTYISLLSAGNSCTAIWERFALVPCVCGMELPWYSWIIYVVGILASLAVILLTNTAVSRAVYMNLKGETFFTWKEAFSFAFKRWGSVVAAPTAIIGIIAFFVVGALIMGLLGRIPYVGELGTSFLTLFYMGSALFVFFLLLVLAVALFFVPAIVATTNEDAFEAVFQSFSISTSQPWRIVVYGVLVGAIELLGLLILAFSVKIAWNIFVFLFTPSMGDKFVNFATNGLYLLQSWLYPTMNWADYLLGDYVRYFYFAKDFMPVELPITGEISSYIFAISMLIVAGVVVAYGEAIGNSGVTLMYLIMRKKYDGENLLERKEEEEEKEEKKEEAEAELTETKPEEEKEKNESKTEEEKKKEE